MTIYAYKVEWPATDENVEKVQITGNFDDWKVLGENLVKENDRYVGVIKVEERKKLVFKFVINGEQWVVNNGYKTEYDNSGIENNYAEESDLNEVQEFDREDDFERSIHSEVADSPGKIIAAENEIEPDEIRLEPPHEEKKEEPIDYQIIDDKSNLTQVLTSGSSFAAVSIPESTHSDFGHLDDSISLKNRGELEEELTHDDFTRDDDHDEQFDTPTNSLINSVMLPSSSGQIHAKNVAASTADTSYVNSSTNSRSNAESPKYLQHSGGQVNNSDPTISIVSGGMKAPGSYPDLQSRPSISVSESRSSGRRENLISRFRNFFHY